MDQVGIVKHFVKSNEQHLLSIFANESDNGKKQGALYINVTNLEDVKVYFIKNELMDTKSPHYKTVVSNNNNKKCFIIGIDNNNEFVLIEANLEKTCDTIQETHETQETETQTDIESPIKKKENYCEDNNTWDDILKSDLED